MRKVDIRARVGVLNEALQRRKATPASQHEERQRLVQACADAGDHVLVPIYGFAPSATSPHVEFETCEFCGHQTGVSREQLSRALITA